MKRTSVEAPKKTTANLEVGQSVKNTLHISESYDMTMEAVIAKSMWAAGRTKERGEFRKLFYQTINHDLLFIPEE